MTSVYPGDFVGIRTADEPHAGGKQTVVGVVDRCAARAGGQPDFL
jgi:hypothetical protein